MYCPEMSKVDSGLQQAKVKQSVPPSAPDLHFPCHLSEVNFPEVNTPPKAFFTKDHYLVVVLPAKSITIVSVRLLGQQVKNDINLTAQKQRFGKHLVVPEGLVWPPAGIAIRLQGSCGHRGGTAAPARCWLACARGAGQAGPPDRTGGPCRSTTVHGCHPS